VNVRWRRRSHPRRPAAPVADSQDIAKLLENVHQLRLTLTADLAAAASAIDADEPAVARDIVAADRREVRELSDRLRSLPVPVPEPRPQPRREPARSRRALLALPAVPLIGALAMTGAAALSGGSGSNNDVRAAVHHSASPATANSPSEIRQTATTTLHQLERVVSNHPRGAAVVAVANNLHRQLTAILATAPNNAKRMNEVQHLLAVEQRLLATHHGHAAAVALAASRRIAHLLKQLPIDLPSPPPTSEPPVNAAPTKSSTPKSPTPQSPTPKTTMSKTQSPQPHASTPAPPNPFASPTATTHTTHRAHHHHHHSKNPLLGSGLVDRAP
jgi:hypothetical protein